jgi:hypothetical protein
MFWKRLGALDDPEAPPVRAKAPRRPVDAPKPPKALEGPRRPSSPPEVDSSPPIDVATMLRDQERLWPEQARLRGELPPATANREVLAQELADEIAKLRAVAPATPGDLADELARELAKQAAPPPVALPDSGELATIAVVDDLEACTELAEADRVRRAVWEREAQELEEREQEAERQKRARWAADRGELFVVEEPQGPGVTSAAARSRERPELRRGQVAA